MALYGGLAKENHLSEFGEPLVTGSGVTTAATRRLTALRNLTGDSNIVLADIANLAAFSGTFSGSDITAASTFDLGLKTASDNRQVEINSRAFTQASGDSIAGAAVPNQTVTTTGEVFGFQFKPRIASNIDAATVNGIGIDSELKSGTGSLSSDLRGANMYLGATGSGTIGGNVVGLRMRAEVNINPTGHIIPFVFPQHEGSQGWDGLVKYAEALGTHSMTTNADKTGNAKSGTIKIIANGTVYHIQLYADS